MSTQTPLVSIIMPLYNKRPFVKRAVDSVLSQNFPDWELIVVDDGSTDGSSSEIPRDEPRIRLFRQTNAGPGAARNHGISIARGEYVTFIDADDYYYPQKLEQEMKFLHGEKLADWMMSAYDYESEDEVTFKSLRDIEGAEISGDPLVFDNAFLQLSLSGWAPHGLCAKKKLLERVGGYRENMLWLEITDMNIRCALAEPKILIYPMPLFRVVYIQNSTSRIISRRIEGMKQMGESLYMLSKEYSSYSNILRYKSSEYFISYASSKILTGNNSEARSVLTKKKYPYKRDRRWWKMWIGSWIPKWLLQHLMSKGKRQVEV